MTIPDEQVRWRKSSRSASETACVEVAHNLAAIRDSKNPNGPTLTLRPEAVVALLGAVKGGQLDR